MQTLSIDIETYSSESLQKSGVYRYSEAPDFEILLFGYSVDSGPVKVIDLAGGERIPEEILDALTDDTVTKWAFNANFERVCLSRYLRDLGTSLDPFCDSHPLSTEKARYLNPESWRCSMVWAAAMGLPLSLEGAGAVLGLEKQKLTEGKELIRFFCQPCSPTKANGQRTRNYPCHAPDRWDAFKRYNLRDVEAEMSIQEKLRKFPVPDFIWDEYHIDQEINDRGIALDMGLVENAIAFDERSRRELTAAMQGITNLDNPNSVQQMRKWLSYNGVETESLDKKTVKELIEAGGSQAVHDALILRQQLAKSSVRKYQAMQNAVCKDGRAHGMFLFYGANRTGRWSGRLIQLQNLPQNNLPDLSEARELVRSSDYEMLDMLYDSVPAVLSELIRTAFVPRAGYKFIVSDFSAIEARVLAYLAGEKWRSKVFSDGGDIYCASASRMFGVPVEKHGQNSHLRQKGKIAELACIAEGQLVLTDNGLKPIETVTLSDLLWDGESWVQHEGIIYKGEKEVITYEGLTATPDHLVFVEGESEPIQFGIAAASGARLIQTGDGRRAIRLGENYKPREKMEQEMEPLLCSDSMSGLWFDSMAEFGKSENRKIKRMPGLLTATPGSKMALQASLRSKTALRESEHEKLLQLWQAGNKISFPKRSGCVSLLDGKVWNSREGNAAGSDRQQWGLCSGKPSVCNSYRKQEKPKINSIESIRSKILAIYKNCCDKKTIRGDDPIRDYRGCGKSCRKEMQELAHNKRTARLYDIRNAGKHHRFTVSGKLVHNCGYGGSVGAMKAMGGLEMGLSENDLQSIVTDWRSSNPMIVQFWWDVDHAVKTSIKQRIQTEVHGIRFFCKSRMLFIRLPSGRRLSYVKPRIEENQFGGESVTYEGVGSTKKWERL